MPNPKDLQFDLPTTNRPALISLPEEWYPGVQNYWSKCTSERSVGDHITGVVAVVIHATAGASSSGAVSVMNPAPGKPAASFHWLVPDEDEPQHGRLIWACSREKDAAWHVQNSKFHPAVNNGKTHVNHWSLGIEIVNRQSGGDSFSDWQVAATAQIVRYCYAKYPNLKHVISHARLDPQRRNDPGPNFPWEKFKQLVLGSQTPLSTLPMPKSVALNGSALDHFKTATLAEEEANFKIRENVHMRSLHK
jgi:N-acetylmuramoyl-L-alanine amidase